jgi:hypothetical protein
MNYGQMGCFNNVKTGTVSQTDAFYCSGCFEMLMTKPEITLISVGQTEIDSWADKHFHGNVMFTLVPMLQLRKTKDSRT